MIKAGDKRYSWTRQRMLEEIERLERKVKSLKADKSIHKKLDKLLRKK